jgi:hypothetical protein
MSALRVSANAAAIAIVCLTAACQRANDATPTSPVVIAPPPPQQDQLRLVARQISVSSCSTPSNNVSAGPTVLVVDEYGTARANILVKFAVTAGGGTLDDTVAVSDNAGVATAGVWRLGNATANNLAIATLANGASATFKIEAKPPGRVIAVFQLVTIGGRSVPQTFSGGGTISGGHYYLADDGTYEFAYELGPVTPPAAVYSCATYIAGVNAFDFYLAPSSYPGSEFYQQSNGFFSHATVSGDTMSVKYADFIDFEDEVYVRVAGPSNASRP